MRLQTTNTLIEIVDLSYSYEKESVLENINLSVEKGDFLAFIGQNGGGKSTLLKLIAGINAVQSGSIHFHDTVLKVGYVPQNTNINTNFPIKAFEVVLMGCNFAKKRLFGYTKEEIAHAQNILAKVGMQEYAQNPIGSLSGGQRQRVMIARALCSAPELLLLDEPTSSIDTQGQRQIYELLKELNKEISIIVVSHDISVVLQYASKAAHINKKLTFHDLTFLQNELNLTPEKHICEIELLQMLARQK